MAKQKKQKRDDYKGYYPDEVKCGGKGGYGGGYENKRKNSKHNNDRREDKRSFGSNGNSIKTTRNGFQSDVYIPMDSDRHDSFKRNYETKEPVATKENKYTENKKANDKVYHLPEIKAIEGKPDHYTLPIEFSKYGLSTIKLLSLPSEGYLFVVDGKFRGPKTALIINDRDPEKGFKAAVVLNEGDYVCVYCENKLSVYSVAETAVRNNEEERTGVATVKHMEAIDVELSDIMYNALDELKADSNYVYARAKAPKKNTRN